MSTASQFFNNVEKYIPKLGVLRLKDLIKQIRACKTAADERAVIAKESAFIRTSFREENNETRHINVAKLLYIHMLGYPAHFGQMECLKLVASPRFADKRLGYLGIMLLLDENQEVLTLVTNCLKNDMNNSNMYIVGLALCTLGNISSQEMARDLSLEVEKLLGSSNTYIRKKAGLCALRIIKKVPDLMEDFLTRAKNLLNERNHGVLLTGLTLLTEMCTMSPEVTTDLRKSVPTLVRHLKNLVTAGFSPEHDVSGITDPFLQVKILRLMRILGKGDAEASDAMNDVLAQVATNTEASKNVGNAILYETVLTIMDIESESSLRVLGINILGRFLANRDNNIRYVALTTLTKTSQSAASADSSALQRHRSTILDCLRDPDISIRRRALDLSFFLINSQNIRILTRELLSFLEIAEGDVKNSVAVRICEFAGRYRPNKRWEVDTVCRVLRVAGAYVDQSVVNHFVKLITTSPSDLQQYAVRKMYNIVKNEGERALTQEGLLQAMVWCVGEYGDVLVDSNATSGIGADEEESADPTQGEYQIAPSETEVVTMFTELLRGPYATVLVKEYAVTAMVKLTGRFTGETTIGQLKALIAKYQVNIDTELQQRAVEYGQILNLDRETRVALLERMPVLESAVKEEAKKGSGAPIATATDATPTKATAGDILGGLNDDLMGLSVGGSTTAAGGGSDIYNMVFGGAGAGAGGAAAAAKSDNIMDLLGGIGLGSSAAPASAPSAAKPTNDLLGDLFGGGAVTSPSVSTPSKPTAMVDPLADLLGGFGGSTSASTPAPAATSRSYTCYDKNGFKITLTPTREAAAEGVSLNVSALLANNGASGPVSNVAFQVAVPKTQSIVWLQPLTSTTIAPGGTATQVMRIDNPKKAPVRLRLKVLYSIGGQQVDEIVEFSQFDSSLWA
ncbi:clathrin associated protein complex large subunit [Borealophlyctis nickersoniae]|nr:clathrin associated protein complex large subunit [Borealophlyctis nickersoniae]